MTSSIAELRPFRPTPRERRPPQIATTHFPTPKRWGNGQDWYGGESPKSCTRDDMSDVALMGRACDIWYEAWHKGMCLTPPYISMKNWYTRLQVETDDHFTQKDVEDDVDFDVAVDTAPEFMSDEGE